MFCVFTQCSRVIYTSTVSVMWLKPTDWQEEASPEAGLARRRAETDLPTFAELLRTEPAWTLADDSQVFTEAKVANDGVDKGPALQQAQRRGDGGDGNGVIIFRVPHTHPHLLKRPLQHVDSLKGHDFAVRRLPFHVNTVRGVNLGSFAYSVPNARRSFYLIPKTLRCMCGCSRCLFSIPGMISTSSLQHGG